MELRLALPGASPLHGSAFGAAQSCLHFSQAARAHSREELLLVLRRAACTSARLPVRTAAKSSCWCPAMRALWPAGPLDEIVTKCQQMVFSGLVSCRCERLSATLFADLLSLLVPACERQHGAQHGAQQGQAGLCSHIALSMSRTGRPLAGL